MTCPLCRKRPAKRACPALRQDICTVCCATKRLVEIQCTEDCRYLEAAQRHPAAVVKRQIDRDVTLLMASVGRLTEQQLQLFFLLQSMVLSYKPEGLGRLVDADIALATGALAGSLESASKGVIFEEATASVVAEGLRRAMRAGARRNHQKQRIPRRTRGRDRPASDGTRGETRRRPHPRRGRVLPRSRGPGFPTTTPATNHGKAADRDALTAGTRGTSGTLWNRGNIFRFQVLRSFSSWQ